MDHPFPIQKAVHITLTAWGCVLNFFSVGNSHVPLPGLWLFRLQLILVTPHLIVGDDVTQETVALSLIGV